MAHGMDKFDSYEIRLVEIKLSSKFCGFCLEGCPLPLCSYFIVTLPGLPIQLFGVAKKTS